MGATKMHADEIETDVALVHRLLAGQFPQWADLPIDPVESYGTNHDIYPSGRGWALYQAVSALAYYWTPTLGMIRQAPQALNQVLANTGPLIDATERLASVTGSVPCRIAPRARPDPCESR